MLLEELKKKKLIHIVSIHKTGLPVKLLCEGELVKQ